MSKFKSILIALLAGGLVVLTGYMSMKTIDEKLQSRLPDEIFAETEETEAPESAIEAVFEPIETEEVQTNDIETEMAETSAETSDTALSESSPEIQPIVQEVPGVHVETDGEPLIEYDESDLMLIARIIQNEAGADIATDEHQRAVASVVLNRVNDARFPDTVYGVISQGWNGECPLQYAVGGAERFFSIVPTDRAIVNAQYVLTYGSTVADAVWQAEFIQGEIVAVFEYPGTGFGTTYICR